MGAEVGKICVKSSTPFVLDWEIPDFFSRLQRFECFTSPIFLFCNESWKLRMRKHSISSEFMHLSLADCHEKEHDKHHISYNVSIINADGRKSEYMEGKALFNSIFLILCRFPEATELLQNQKEISLGGTWTISCVFQCTYHLEKSRSITAVEGKEELNGGNANNSMEDEDTICSTKEEVFSAITGKEELNAENAKNSVEKKDTICSTNEEITPAIIDSERLLQDMESLFLTGKCSDVTLIVQDRKFPVHRLMLGARSSVFEAMFNHDVVETATGVVNITDFDPDVFHDFLLYLYSAKVERLSEEKVIGLYSAADKYDTQELKAKCVQYMRDNLSIDMFYSVVSIALQHQESSLLEAATNFFVENLKQIIVKVEWQEFLKENPTAANELLIKASGLYVPPKEKK